MPRTVLFARDEKTGLVLCNKTDSYHVPAVDIRQVGFSTLKGRLGPSLEGADESALAVTCGFRFEVRPEDEVVELEANHHTVHVCLDCLALLTVHRRIHHMKVEKVSVQTG